MRGEEGVVVLLRRGVLALAAIGVAGVAVELALLRHWNGLVQILPWLGLGAGAVAVGLVAIRPTPGRVRLARLIALAVLGLAAFGILEHVLGNHEAGPLDAEHGEGWESLSQVTRWWYAITETVGPSPTFAPAALAQIVLLVLLATVRHPALGRLGTRTRAAAEPA